MRRWCCLDRGAGVRKVANGEANAAATEIYNQFAGPGVGCAANSALPKTSRNCSAAAVVIRKLPTASIWFSVSVFETLAEDQRKRYRQNGSAESGGWNG